MLFRFVWWATFGLLVPMTGLAESCPPYSIGLHHQHQSLISVARSEILNIDDPSSIEIAKSEAKIKAKSQLVKEIAPKKRAGTLNGVSDIATCQSDEFIYASIKLMQTSHVQASYLSDEIAKSIESQPTPLP